MISIHAAREGGDIVALPVQKLIYISIHAAREGGDIVAFVKPLQLNYFNPRRP